MDYFPKIVGKRIFLSPINPDDAEFYTALVNDMEISANIGKTHQVYSLSRERDYLEEVCQDGHHFAIVLKNEGRLLGNCGLEDVDLVNRTAELGILLEKKSWNQGLGQEAIELLLDYAFHVLNINNVMLSVYSYNQRAINCYKKCGFKEIGRRREARFFGGQLYDEIYMDYLASDFKGFITDFLE